MGTLNRLRKKHISRGPLIIVIGLGVLLCVLILWQTAYWARQIALREISERSRHTLSLVIENLRGQLAKHRYQPQLLASNPSFRAALKGEATPQQIAVLNVELEKINSISGALDTYLMDKTGLTVAASNWSSSRPFVGKNFSYRPYFQTAMDGRLGRYFALGSTSRERGYYFAYPVRNGFDILGAIVVKMQVGHLESGWRAPDHNVLVVDSKGVIFLSSNPDWRFHTVKALSSTEIRAIRASRKYGNHSLPRLAITDYENDDGFEFVTILNQNKIKGKNTEANGKPEEYLIQRTNMTDAGWGVMLLAKTEGVKRQVNIAVAVAGFMLASIFLAAVNIYQRQHRLADRIALQEAVKVQLEERVKERTNELMQANNQLRTEIMERERTEAELRRTQAGLVQATKLAALGQMSAGLSHELNQPLAAIRSYADNARAFIERQKPEFASANLKGIAELIDRMARIIKNLRTYARKEPITTRPTSIRVAINEALELLDRRIKHDDVIVIKHLPQNDVLVVGGNVRLQQVFVNLFSNALDAMTSVHPKKLRINVYREKERVICNVWDAGHGIPADHLQNVFDPFFSTKEVGEGMGLGLSITYGIVQQLGGSIEVNNHPDGGAIFTLKFVPVLRKEGEAA